MRSTVLRGEGCGACPHAEISVQTYWRIEMDDSTGQQLTESSSVVGLYESTSADLDHLHRRIRHIWKRVVFGVLS